MQTKFTHSSVAVRVLYCLCLLSVAFGLFNGMHNLVVLLASPGIYTPMNVLVAVVPNAATAALFLLVVARLLGVIAGKFKLSTLATSGPLRVMRVIAVVVMAVSVLPWLFSLIGALSHRGSDGVGFVLLAGSLGGGASVGVLLFEAARILERELLLESRAAT